MAGRLALGAEVFLGLDEPDAEELGPVAVDRDAGRQRVLGVDQPRASPSRFAGAPAG